MRTWTAYIERDGKRYFVCQGERVEIQGLAAKRIADLEMDTSILREVQYEEMTNIPFNMGYLEELI